MWKEYINGSPIISGFVIGRRVEGQVCSRYPQILGIESWF